MIEINSIIKTYHLGEVVVEALRGVSFEIDSGEMVAITGPSGCGKSTLMHIMGCLDSPTSGRYVLDGVDVSKLSDVALAEVRNKKIGFVFQSYNLISRTSAIANVELPLLYGNISNGNMKAMEALERVGLRPRANHMPNQLSGGEQQRVSIARAMVNKPSIILADEPTGNLDSRASKEIIDILESLHRDDGITIIIVTHDPEVAARARRRILLRDGQVIEDKLIPSRQGVAV